jgi:hypothetical protein
MSPGGCGYVLPTVASEKCEEDVAKRTLKRTSQWNSRSEICRPEIAVFDSKTPATSYLPPQLFWLNRNSLTNRSLQQKWRAGALPRPRRAQDQSGSSQVKFGEETTKTILRSVIPWACALSAGTEASLFRMSDKNLVAIGLARRSPYASSSLPYSQL